MTERNKKYLFDILSAIDLIEKFTVDITNYNSYNTDLKTQSAVERQLVIIGEALNQINKSNSGIKIENDKRIIEFRNRLVHAYDSVDNSIVWVILIKHLNKLKREIEVLSQQYN